MTKLLLTHYWLIYLIGIFAIPITLGTKHVFTRTFEEVYDVKCVVESCSHCHEPRYHVYYCYKNNKDKEKRGDIVFHTTNGSPKDKIDAVNFMVKIQRNGVTRKGGIYIFLLTLLWAILGELIGVWADTHCDIYEEPSYYYDIKDCIGCPFKVFCGEGGTDEYRFTTEAKNRAQEKLDKFMGKTL